MHELKSKKKKTQHEVLLIYEPLGSRTRHHVVLMRKLVLSIEETQMKRHNFHMY